LFNLSHASITYQLINVFSQKFAKQLKDEIEKLARYKINVEDFFPEVLTKEYGMNIIFSMSKGHFMIIFTKANPGRVYRSFVKGDVIDLFDETGSWSRNEGSIGFQIEESSNINLKGISFGGGIKPFSLNGNIGIYIENMDFHSPTGRKTNIEYAFILSYSRLVDTIVNIEQFTSNLVYAYWSYFNQYNEKLNSESDKYQKYIHSLKATYNEMNYYFYDENVLERDIENFINKNSVLISEILGLDNPIVQANLKDVNQTYGQVLKPDLMGYDSVRKNWTIVDYKTGRGANLVKSPGGVRVKFYDDVAKLEAQLRIYRKYFNERDHRDYFNKKYNTTIHEYPHTIGIIGKVEEESRKDFNELMDEKLRWFELVPYNDLQARFKKLISMVENIS
jgi:hypothetical protein